MTSRPVDADVAIVGYGPVGQVLGALLAGRGHRVCVIERFAQVYPLPRAIRFDGEVMRIFQRLGIVEEIRDELVENDHYPWFGADGELIVDIDTSRPHPSGWRNDYAFYQPAVEQALDRVAKAQPTLEVRHGWACEDLVQHEDHVALTVRRGVEPTPGDWVATEQVGTITARYAVGADGARSVVRDLLGVGYTDVGFSEQWLVADVRPHDMSAFDHLPVAAQYCDPVRPHVVVRNGARHRRWEFMLLEGEDPAAYARDPALAWRLLAHHIAPEDGELIRHAVYEFRSLLVDTMRAGRVALAGDAAHLMPPFMGEGMCSGLRDANNLAWRLDLVLRDVAPEDLLDGYTPERRHQTEATIAVSVQMGKVTCMLDPEAAAARDAAFRRGDVPPPPALPGIGRDGLVAPGDDPLAGEKAVQGVVEAGGVRGRFDDVVGRGFVLVLADGDPVAVLGPDRIAYVEDELGGVVVSLDPAAPGGVRDADGALTAWLAGHGVQAVLSRPDAYVFGSARDAAGAAQLVDALRTALRAPAPEAR